MTGFELWISDIGSDHTTKFPPTYLPFDSITECINVLPMKSNDTESGVWLFCFACFPLL